MGLREDKKDRTRAQLLEAALDLIHKRGFEETTVADIAAAVSVSPRTLLRYFPTKEDVIVSWVQDGMTIVRAELTERLASEPPVVALLAAARTMLWRSMKVAFLSRHRDGDPLQQEHFRAKRTDDRRTDRRSRPYSRLAGQAVSAPGCCCLYGGGNGFRAHSGIDKQLGGWRSGNVTYRSLRSRCRYRPFRAKCHLVSFVIDRHNFPCNFTMRC